LAIVVGAAWAAASAPGRARAQSLDVPTGAASAATVGRAGVGVVSADDGAALWLNPAGLARRSHFRLQLGWTWHTIRARFTSDEAFGTTSMAVQRAQSAPAGAPIVAVQGPVGPRVVIGAAWITPTTLELSWPTPPPQVVPDPDDRARFPGRYAGSATRLERRGVAVGASWRARPWLAVGAAAWALSVDVEEARTVWGGEGRVTALANLAPAYDVPLVLRGRDRFVPGASLGVLVAPLDSPLELGLSVTWTRGADLRGTPSLGHSRGTAGQDGPRLASGEVAADATSTRTMDGAVVVRTGARFLLPRLAIEVDGELGVAPQAERPAPWQLSGVILAGSSRRSAPLTGAPTQLALQAPLAIRAAIEIDAVPGFLTGSLGVAYDRGGSARPVRSPGFVGADGVLVAGGVQATVTGAAISLGVAHYLGVERAAPSELTVLAPLAEGTVRAGSGRHDGGSTTASVAVEWTW
jgi:hypothetical protein